MIFNTVKDPNATLDYTIDWTAWLGTDSISDSSWSIDIKGSLSLTDGGVEQGVKAVVWLSGGKVGTTYNVVNRITTTAGRVDERTIVVLVQDQ